MKDATTHTFFDDTYGIVTAHQWRTYLRYDITVEVHAAWCETGWHGDTIAAWIMVHGLRTGRPGDIAAIDWARELTAAGDDPDSVLRSTVSARGCSMRSTAA